VCISSCGCDFVAGLGDEGDPTFEKDILVSPKTRAVSIDDHTYENHNVITKLFSIRNLSEEKSRVTYQLYTSCWIPLNEPSVFKLTPVGRDVKSGAITFPLLFIELGAQSRFFTSLAHTHLHRCRLLTKNAAFDSWLAQHDGISNIAT
jgi:hypothetical protein